ncbi:MAG: hypothetical protein C4529_06205 [Deltaproteobacteria bacterium]|nr:MAG: hypothetical protein C4529_06205 [Deltaproteobacteria bacterium]
MTRKTSGASKNLQRREFGTAGHRLPEEILGRPIVLPEMRAWKPRPGRVCNFPFRTEPDGK